MAAKRQLKSSRDASQQKKRFIISSRKHTQGVSRRSGRRRAPSPRQVKMWTPTRLHQERAGPEKAARQRPNNDNEAALCFLRGKVSRAKRDHGKSRKQAPVPAPKTYPTKQDQAKRPRASSHIAPSSKAWHTDELGKHTATTIKLHRSFSHARQNEGSQAVRHQARYQPRVPQKV